MSSFLDLSSPSQEERLNEGAASAYDVLNNEWTATATPFHEDEEQEMHGPIQDTNIGMRGDYTNHNDHHLRDDYAEEHNTDQTDLSRKQRAWIQKQKQAINEEDNAAQHKLQSQSQSQSQSPITVDDEEEEVPQSYGCTDIPLPNPERIDDAAAISVMVYLLVIAFLLAISILIG
eukprot:CAMPEP_0201692102 /NCGR_PEP_ID=MMETSP0578-20130828/5095_1 /ASSEMBLY_ACC=CAM_ASM_000663 /TAXON_ID=267565 /ORGANISM="Skeletonema grethea, Strain CCMP 1804" /LENGTH=174 /DNA_ID=CAMNT_0048177429 /DNA_START=60 /DNA_END=581 /DNA_ORIENTATION=+